MLMKILIKANENGSGVYNSLTAAEAVKYSNLVDFEFKLQ